MAEAGISKRVIIEREKHIYKRRWDYHYGVIEWDSGRLLAFGFGLHDEAYAWAYQRGFELVNK